MEHMLAYPPNFSRHRDFCGRKLWTANIFKRKLGFFCLLISLPYVSQYALPQDAAWLYENNTLQVSRLWSFRLPKYKLAF